MELKRRFFSILYHWTTAIDCFHFSKFHDFLDIFSFSSQMFLLYTFLGTWVVFIS
jgi:hypothetical protein